MVLTYSEATDANGERLGRVAEAASRAAKSAELASLQTTRSLTYLTLNSSLITFGFWSRLATALSIRVLERQVEISKSLADVLNDASTKPALEKWEKSIPPPTIGETAEKLATAADAAIREAARKTGDNADLAGARLYDDTKRVVAAGSDAARETVNAGIDVTKAAVDAGIGVTEGVIDSGFDATKEVVAAGSDAANADAGDDLELPSVAWDGYPELETTTEGDQEIELRSERLVVNKQRRQTGEARVRKQVVSEVKSIDVPVSHEELVIERYAATHDFDVDGEPIAEETIRIPLTEERVNVSKETVVREEVEIGTQRVDDVEHINDTVRHEELVVDGVTTT